MSKDWIYDNINATFKSYNLHFKNTLDGYMTSGAGWEVVKGSVRGENKFLSRGNVFSRALS